jgi:hypothetical protein
MKPKLYAAEGISNNFRDRDKSISISIDTASVDQTANLKVFVQIEPQSIRNTLPQIVDNKDMFDLILAWDEDILNLCSNSKRFIYGDLWVDLERLNPNKENKVSFLMSNKSWTKGHRFRHEVYSLLENINVCNGFSVDRHMSPPRIESKNSIFDRYKYSIIIENEQNNNWITEKLIDCLATKTIPLYWGASNVGEFFDTKGIIQFNTLEELEHILSNDLSSEHYENLEHTLNSNAKEALTYSNFFNRVDKEIDNIL